jgi:UDP-glucose 4-epimerase
MHFAAFIDVGESVREPAKYYENNVIKTLNLLNIMLKYQVKTLIFSSSAAIFGYPQANHIVESHACHPINPYGETKWMVEKILHDFDRAYGLKSCCFRYFNAAGGDPTGHIKNYQTQVTNLIPLALQSIKCKRPLTIFGTDYPTLDGTCIRDYIHIHDLGTAHLLGMERLFTGSSSLAYNLGNGQGYSVKEVIRAVETVTNQPLIVQEGKRRPGDPPILLADASLARHDLGWQPIYTDLETMIEHAWKALNVS